MEYVFTDKTGTLTENDMQFRECSINGLKYVVSSFLELWLFILKVTFQKFALRSKKRLTSLMPWMATGSRLICLTYCVFLSIITCVKSKPICGLWILVINLRQKKMEMEMKLTIFFHSLHSAALTPHPMLYSVGL